MRKLLPFATTLAFLVSAACTVHQSDVPSVSGPSGLALSLKLQATPDMLVQDGSQFSKIAVSAFNAGGQPIAVNVHLDVSVNGGVQDYGTLSAHSVMTGTDAANPTIVTYVPPAAATGVSNTVTILGKLIASDASASSAQQVLITIVPVTLQAPPTSSTPVAAPTAKFTFSPTSPGTNQDVFFNATSSTAAAGHRVASYAWDFGDGSTGSGSTPSHAFARSGTFTVTLVVTDDLGQTGNVTSTVTVSSTSSQIVADFVFSPTDPSTGALVFFDATPSSSPSLPLSYAWDFGDGGTCTNAGVGCGAGTPKNPQHSYAAPTHTWVVRLTVTDAAGRSASTTKNVTTK